MFSGAGVAIWVFSGADTSGGVSVERMTWLNG